MHAVDWFPTIMSLVGGQTRKFLFNENENEQSKTSRIFYQFVFLLSLTAFVIALQSTVPLVATDNE